MKLKTFVWGGVITIGVAAGITSAVVFSNLEKQNSPYLKVLTKETYNKFLKDQKIDNDGKKPFVPATVYYNSLPTSGISFMDLLTKKVDGNAFMITVGSEGYETTNKLLYKRDSTGKDPFNNKLDSSSLMANLYDLFFNEKNNLHNLVEEYSNSMMFYSYIDIVATNEVFEAQNLLHERRTKLGDKAPEPTNPTENNTPTTQIVEGKSRLWEVPVEKESTKTQDLPVVKPSSGGDIVNFDYTPTESYYEFRKDNKIDTEYEKVYYRNQETVKAYNQTIDWASSFASSFLQGASFSKEGSLVCAKKQDDLWYFISFTSNDTETVSQIAEWYQKKEVVEEGENNGDQEQQPQPETPAPSPASLSIDTTSQVYQQSQAEFNSIATKSQNFVVTPISNRKK